MLIDLRNNDYLLVLKKRKRNENETNPSLNEKRSQVLKTTRRILTTNTATQQQK